MNTTTSHYACIGPVRGECGTKHRSREAAEAHCDKDHRAVRNLPGGTSYSDRAVWLVDSEGRYHRPDAMIAGRFAEVGITHGQLMGWS